MTWGHGHGCRCSPGSSPPSSPIWTRSNTELYAAAEARALGHGGISRVARAAGLSRPTIYQGLSDLDALPIPGRVRRPAAAVRRPRTATPTCATLDALIEPTTRGDPGSPYRLDLPSTASWRPP